VPELLAEIAELRGIINKFMKQEGRSVEIPVETLKSGIDNEVAADVPSAPVAQHLTTSTARCCPFSPRMRFPHQSNYSLQLTMR
jgi:hypothetical protein